MQISRKVLQKSYSKNIQLLQIFAENKQSDDALNFLTTSCLNKHNFEFKQTIIGCSWIIWNGAMPETKQTFLSGNCMCCSYFIKYEEFKHILLL